LKNPNAGTNRLHLRLKLTKPVDLQHGAMLRVSLGLQALKMPLYFVGLGYLNKSFNAGNTSLVERLNDALVFERFTPSDTIFYQQ
jgi:hypothetical protein